MAKKTHELLAGVHVRLHVLARAGRRPPTSCTAGSPRKKLPIKPPMLPMPKVPKKSLIRLPIAAPHAPAGPEQQPEDEREDVGRPDVREPGDDREELGGYQGGRVDRRAQGYQHHHLGVPPHRKDLFHRTSLGRRLRLSFAVSSLPWAAPRRLSTGSSHPTQKHRPDTLAEAISCHAFQAAVTGEAQVERDDSSRQTRQTSVPAGHGEAAESRCASGWPRTPWTPGPSRTRWSSGWSRRRPGSAAGRVLRTRSMMLAGVEVEAARALGLADGRARGRYRRDEPQRRRDGEGEPVRDAQLHQPGRYLLVAGGGEEDHAGNDRRVYPERRPRCRTAAASYSTNRNSGVSPLANTDHITDGDERRS